VQEGAVRFAMVKDRRRNEENILDIRAGIIGSSDLRAILRHQALACSARIAFRLQLAAHLAVTRSYFAKMLL
jgi:hypothetical protein